MYVLIVSEMKFSSADHDDFGRSLEKWTFCHPYQPLVHRWTHLQDLHRNIMQDPDSPSDKKEAIQTLMDFLTPILVPCIKKYAKVQEAGMVSYQDLWQLFPPSEVVVAKLWDLPVICRVVQHEVEDGFFDLTCEYVDWDGRDSGLRQETFRLGWFQGLVHVNSLEVYPLSFHKDPDALKERLLQRGRKWERLRGCHQQVYKGKMMTMLPPQEDRIVRSPFFFGGHFAI